MALLLLRRRRVPIITPLLHGCLPVKKKDSEYSQAHYLFVIRGPFPAPFFSGFALAPIPPFSIQDCLNLRRGDVHLRPRKTYTSRLIKTRRQGSRLKGSGEGKSPGSTTLEELAGSLFPFKQDLMHLSHRLYGGPLLQA